MRIITTPTVVKIERGLEGGPSPVDLDIILPSVAPPTGVTLNVYAPAAWGPTIGFIVASTVQSTPQHLTGPAVAPGTQWHVELSSLVALIPFITASGQAQEALPVAPYHLELAGLPLYTQVVALHYTGISYMSDAFLVVLF
jgi:hypothetical protein